MASQAGDIARPNEFGGKLVDEHRFIRFVGTAFPYTCPFTPEDVAGGGIDMGARSIGLREVTHLLVNQIDHAERAMERRRKSTVEPEIAPIRAHRVVDKIKALLHRRHAFGQYIAGHAGCRVGERGKELAVLQVDHCFNFLTIAQHYHLRFCGIATQLHIERQVYQRYTGLGNALSFVNRLRWCDGIGDFCRGWIQINTVEDSGERGETRVTLFYLHPIFVLHVRKFKQRHRVYSVVFP
ncbi:MAG: hypothetical protein R2932_02075 [Caldilineaceae bacterium]